MTPAQAKLISIVVVGCVAVVAIIVAAVDGSPGSSPAKSTGSNDPASLLAQRDGSADVAAYSTALDAWQAVCTANRVTDAGIVDASFKDEQANGGPDKSRLVTMRNLTASVPASVAPTDCAGVAAAYLVLVEPSP